MNGLHLGQKMRIEEQGDIQLIAESAVFGLLSMYGPIKDVRFVPEYQKQDIDFIWTFDGTPINVEVKGDSYPERNIVIETKILHPDRTEKGWFYITEAEMLIYCYINEDIIYMLRMDRMKKWLTTETLEKYPEREVIKNNNGFMSVVRLVPLKDIPSGCIRTKLPYDYEGVELMSDNEQIKFGAYPNRKAGSSNAPNLFLWMGRLSDGLVEIQPGAMWLSTSKDCPEKHKEALNGYIKKVLGAMDKENCDGKAWIKLNGNLEVQAIYDALGSNSPKPEEKAPEPQTGPDDDDGLPF